MKIWFLVIVISGFCTGTWGLAHLWTDLSETKKENLFLEAKAESYALNLELVQTQLETERKIREATETALSDLSKVVSYEEYNQAVPDSIQRVLDQFRQSFRDDRLQ